MKNFAKPSNFCTKMVTMIVLKNEYLNLCWVFFTKKKLQTFQILNWPEGSQEKAEVIKSVCEKRFYHKQLIRCISNVSKIGIFLQ